MTPHEEMRLIARMICLWVLDRNPDAETYPNEKSEMKSAKRIWGALERSRDRATKGQEPEPMEIMQAR